MQPMIPHLNVLTFIHPDWGILNRVTQLRINDVHCRESAGTGSVVLKIVPVTGAAILQVTMDQLICRNLRTGLARL